MQICENCKYPITVPENLLRELGVEDKKVTFYEGKGCDECRNSKYTGRTTIHEFFVMTDAMRELITKRGSDIELVALAKKQGMRTLRESGLDKARRGITSLEEVLKVTKQD